MIVSLRGKLIEATVLRVVIESAGVGYEVNIPVTTAERLPKVGSEIFLLIHHVFREDGQALYGFAVPEERDFFRLLVEKVSGVGPKLALTILSRLSLPVLRDAIIRSDVTLLSQCPGIGKKNRRTLSGRTAGQIRSRFRNFFRQCSIIIRCTAFCSIRRSRCADCAR